MIKFKNSFVIKNIFLRQKCLESCLVLIFLAAASCAAAGAAPDKEQLPPEFGGREGYAGSASCKECHPDEYALWSKTPHSRMLVDAKKNPDAILPTDFSGMPFTKDDILYTVGSHWVQKYLTRMEDGLLYQLPKIWNVPKRAWEPYTIFNWNVKPYNIFCDGCHTVGFDVKTKTFFEPGVGCEACHGPGKKHIEGDGDVEAIVNPRKLSADRAQMICMSCHTDGDDKVTGEHPFAAGFTPGDDLNDYYTEFFMPKPKSNDWYWGTMDLKERKRMWYFFQSKFYSTQRACDICGLQRGGEHKERYMTPSEYCGTCHTFRYNKYEKHSGHDPEKTQCDDCHVPTLIASGERYSIHDHKFNFSQPEPPCTECHEEADVKGKKAPEKHEFHLPRMKYKKNMTLHEACLRCHKDKDIEWAKKTSSTLADQYLSP